MVKWPEQCRGVLGAWIACAVAVGAMGSMAAAQGSDGPPDPPPPAAAGTYTVYWCVGANAGTGWADGIDFRGMPINRHIDSCGPIGLYPRAGPHIADSDPTWLQRHLTRLDQDIETKFPDATFDGPIAIDWEDWMPLWRHTLDEPSSLPADALDRDFKTDWREHIRATRPQLLVGLAPADQERVFAATYEDCAKNILLASIQECKRMRPLAQWGFYTIPTVGYWDALNNHMDEIAADDDRLQALWDASDVLFPCIYQTYQTDASLPPRDDTNRFTLTQQTQKNTPEENEVWVGAQVAEAVRVAHGKPVYPFIWSRYMPTTTADLWSGSLVNDVNLQQMIDLPKRYGANGIVVWDYFNTLQQSTEFRDFFDRKLGPRLMIATSPSGQGNVNFRLDLVYRQPNGQLVILRGEEAPNEEAQSGHSAALLGDVAPAAGAPNESGQGAKADARSGAPTGSSGGGGTGRGPRRTAAVSGAAPSPPLPPPVKGAGRRKPPFIVRTVPDPCPKDPGPPAITVPPSKFHLTPPWAVAPTPEEQDPS